MKHAIFLLALPPVLALGGCISFGAKPPPTLLDLTAAQAVPVGRVQSSAGAKSITIQVPVVPQALATARVPVQAGPTSVAYIKDAVWVEPPQRLFARLLSDTISARSGRVVLSSAQSFADPGAVLSGELRNFGADAATNSAVVTFDAALMRGTDAKGDAGAVEKRRFEARVPLGTIDAAAIGPALNQAANQVAGEVSDWVGN